MEKIILTLFLLFITQLSFTAQVDKQYNILYINSYHSGFTWSDSIEEGFIQEMNRQDIDYNIYFERLDSKRFPLEKTNIEIYNLIRSKYSNNFFNAVVTSDDNALNFVAEQREILFPGIPIIFSGVNDRENKHILDDKNIAGVIEDVDIYGLIELILTVHPKTKQIAIIGDQTASSDVHIKNTIGVIKQKFPYLTYSIHKDWTLNSLRSELKDLQSNTIIVELAMHLDINNNAITFSQQRDLFTKRVHIPVYSLWDTRLNNGIVGGLMTAGSIHGQVAAKITSNILRGSFPSTPILNNIPYPTYFDYEMLKLLRIPLDNIPENAIFINKPDSLWYKYKTYIITIIFFTLAQALLIVLLIINVSRKKVAQAKLIVLNKSLEDKVILRTKDLEGSLSNLKLTQRSLIESEKMAALGSIVAGIAHQINTPIGICTTMVSFLKGELEKDSKGILLEPFTLLEKNINKVADTIKNFRQVSVNLISETPQVVNIFDFIEQILASQKKLIDSKNVNLNLEINDNIEAKVYTGVLLKVFIILIKNSISHGFKADIEYPEIMVEVLEEKQSITIRYSDNGQGIEPENYKKIFDPFYTTTLGQGNNGLGLNIAYNEIVHRLKGTIKVDFNHVKGLGLIIKFPKIDQST